MKIKKNVLIAGALICISMIFFFLIYLFVLSQSIISMETTNNLKITAQLSQQINTLDDSESATQSPNPPGVYSVKMLVRISGTGEDGLRIRANAGLNEVTMFLGSEGEVFEIIDGPEIIDNSIWWKIQAIDNHSKFGWAVQVYLSQY